MCVFMRPQQLDELIGHNDVKAKARIAIAAALSRAEPLPHCLLTSSGGGLGKTTLAQILANELYVGLVQTSATCIISPTDLRNLLVRLEPNSCVLIDEFHAIGRAAAEELLLVLEENVLNVNAGSSGPIRISLPAFTLIGATTKPESLSAPLAQRFALKFHLEPLLLDEMRIVARRIFTRWQIETDDAVVNGLAARSRGNPRQALRLAERVRDVVQARQGTKATTECFELAMKIEGVDGLGLTRQEQQLLRCLAVAEPRAVSARSLALGLGVNVQTVNEVLEPPLIRLGLLTVGTGGRRLTVKGLEHLAGDQGNKGG
jgi:Holliday junction DNA helicase RuvB